MDFSELDLSPEVLQAVCDAGYTNPTPIQEQAIPHVKRGRDFLGCAQTGTGKTASFVLPMVDMLAAGRARVRMPRSLILEPTRELATQVAASFELYGKHHRLTMALLIGGESFVDQERKLEESGLAEFFDGLLDIMGPAEKTQVFEFHFPSSPTSGVMQRQDPDSKIADTQA